MPHTHRFYVSPETGSSGVVTLAAEEAHHAIHVVRVRPGDGVALFDGKGREIDARVDRVDRRQVHFEPVAERYTPAETARVALLQAWLHQDKSIEFIIQHGTAIGVAQFCFFRGGHSERTPRFNEKWRKIAIEACKQSGRLWLPDFETFPDLGAAVQQTRGVLLMATLEGGAMSLRETLAGAEEVRLIVGPEGDFTPEEVDLAATLGATPLSLGPYTLRSELAAVLGAGIVLRKLRNC